MKALYWRIKILWLSFRWIFQVNLGDYVWYEGKKYLVYNGVRCGCWRLSKLVDGKDEHNAGWVKRSDCTKVRSIRNDIRSWESGYRFYMTSWYSIWKREGIKDWMRGCRIWPRRGRE